MPQKQGGHGVSDWVSQSWQSNMLVPSWRMTSRRQPNSLAPPACIQGSSESGPFITPCAIAGDCRSLCAGNSGSDPLFFLKDLFVFFYILIFTSMYSVHGGPKKASDFPCTGAAMWVLETKSESSARTFYFRPYLPPFLLP